MLKRTYNEGERGYTENPDKALAANAMQQAVGPMEILTRKRNSMRDQFSCLPVDD